MTRLFNDPDDFAEEPARGFAAASARRARPVPGGGVPPTRRAEPHVPVAIGGRSCHLPPRPALPAPGRAHAAPSFYHLPPP
mgnify:CR=1 FL=1